MTVIIFLIAAGALVALVFLAAFFWAVTDGQFDDTSTPPVRMLLDERDVPVMEPSVRGGPHV